MTEHASSILVLLKCQSTRGASHHLAFMGSSLTINHGIRGHMLVYKEVVEALSNYKKYYFWWYGNLDCGDATGSNQIEKFQPSLPLGPAWEKRGEWIVWFTVFEVPLDDLANGGYVTVLFACDECVFSYFKNWSCSEE